MRKPLLKGSVAWDFWVSILSATKLAVVPESRTELLLEAVSEKIISNNFQNLVTQSLYA